MSTLLLRLAAPLQSWGVASKFDTRLTETFPSKSGIVGMLACALGRSREDNIQDLSELKFGLRVEQRGELLVDFQMVHENIENKNASMWVTRHHYLADAVFLVGLEGDNEFLNMLVKALKNPIYPIYLGRRSCPPAGKIVLGIVESNLKIALSDAPWQAADWYKNKHSKNNLELFTDAEKNDVSTFTLRDIPISFDQRQREYGFRDVVRSYVSIQQKENKPMECKNNCEATEHDPMALLEV